MLDLNAVTGSITVASPIVASLLLDLDTIMHCATISKNMVVLLYRYITVKTFRVKQEIGQCDSYLV